MKGEWASGNFDWRDESLDEHLAEDWLANQRLWRQPRRSRTSPGLPDDYDLDVDDWALELVMSDLAPERGWQLIRRVLDLARDDQEVTHIAVDLLETFLREHAEAFLPQIEGAAKTEPRFAAALRCVYLPAGHTGELIRRLAETA